MAIGRPLADFEARTCFSCHTTAMFATSPIDEHSIVPSVSCEACHGPGAGHVAAVQASENKAGAWDRHILNPARLAPAQSVDLCGACHSTPWDVRLMGATGVQTVRFPAYRLEKSRCWGLQGDARASPAPVVMIRTRLSRERLSATTTRASPATSTGLRRSSTQSTPALPARSRRVSASAATCRRLSFRRCTTNLPIT